MRAINDLTVPPVSCVGAGSLIDCGRFVRTPLTREPFEFLVAPGFAPRAAAAADSFPGPDPPGVPPAPWVEPNTGFGRLSHALRSPLVTEAFGAQFGLKLTTDTLMVTPWARTRPRDGTIHTDSETKLATALVYLTLVYLNNHWDNAGRLRLSSRSWP